MFIFQNNLFNNSIIEFSALYVYLFETHSVSSPPTPLYHWRSDHLTRLAEATSGPEEVVLVLIAAPVGIGGGSAASAVLCEGSGRIDLSNEKKEGCPKDIARLFRRMGSLNRSALFIKGLHCSARSFHFISLPIQG